ncbi:hypothetical protein AB0C27_56075 [Nonomuraea sp. NPDC048882]|uniref:terminase gpP N-terminus-related DNA-binding protein n=1 Tax=Nonomuraea sp. NPDC048882 TaxID=3154347 RepID=UPI0033EA4FA5
MEQGHGIRGIARQLGWGRHTVQRYARAARWTELVPLQNSCMWSELVFLRNS